MQTLSDRQVAEITRLIEDQHTAFMVNVLGMKDAIDQETLDRLVAKGLIREGASNLSEDAFLFGFMADALEEADEQGMSYAQFKKHLKEKPLPITAEERMAVKHLKRSLMTHLKGLGNSIDKKTQRVIIEGDQALRRRLMQQVKHQLVEGYEKRKTVGEIATELRRSTRDYARDWFRIVHTEINNAYQEGKLQTIAKANKGRDPLVFKRPRGECCDECRDAYLEKGGIPKTFRMSELVNNGSNVGRNKEKRKPVVGSHHPWCQCELHELSPGFEFDKKGRLVYVGFGS